MRSDFSDCETALMHDSDPRYLNFQLIDGSNFDGEGTVKQELGTIVPLNYARPPHETPAVTGPTIGDLTLGGSNGATDTRNRVRFVLQPKVPNAKLVDAGRFTITFYVDLGGDLTPFTFQVDASDFKAYAAATGLSDDSRIDMPTYLTMGFPGFPWDLSAMHGHDIVSYKYDVIIPFSCSGVGSPPMAMATDQKVYIKFDALNSIEIPVMTAGESLVITPPAPITVTSSYFSLGPVLTVDGETGWRTEDTDQVIASIYIDAPSIIAVATSGELAAQQADVWFPGDFFATYQGFKLVDNTGIYGFEDPELGPQGPNSYGPDPLLNDVRNTIVAKYMRSTLGPVIVDSLIPLDPVTKVAGVEPDNDIIRIADRLVLSIDLYPKSHAAIFNDLLFTEPYEIRLRNRPAFKFKCFNVGGDDESVLHIKMFVSQGSPIANDNSARMWTEVPLTYLNGANSACGGYIPATDTATDGIPLACNIDGFPDNYGGCELVMPCGFIGPHNYVRFALTVDNPDSHSGVTLQITANAREL